MASFSDTTSQAVKDAAATIEKTLAEMEVDFTKVDDDHFVADLPGVHRLKTSCHLRVNEHSLHISAFVMRHPDENREQLWEYLLTKNARAYTIAWSIDRLRDVYLTGRLPLIAVTPEEIDRLLGTVLQMADDNFNPMIEIGFRSAIEREYKWRISRGESTKNLEGFAGLIERMQREEREAQTDET